jgi:ABC-type glycerol-3-phosphate transport system substrate-binding protein
MRALAKWLAATAAAVSLAASAACGGAPPTDEKVVEFWYYQPTPEQSKQVKELLKRFEETEPTITVRLTEIPKDDYNTKLSSALGGGRGPDAGYLDQPLMARYANAGQLAEVPAGTITESDFYDGALRTNKISGKLCGIPLQQTTVALFYNRKLVSTPPVTWDELVAESARVHRENPNLAGVNVPKGEGFGAWVFPAFVASAGGTMLDEGNRRIAFADPPAQEALALWHKLLESSPRQITNSENPFHKGLAAMMFSGPWEVLAIRQQFPQLDFGVAPLPRKNVAASNIGGDNGVVFRKARNPDAAWKWLRFLSDATHNAEFSNITGNFPTNRKAAQAAKINTDPAFKVFVDQLETAQARPTVPEWIQINDEYLAKAIEEGVDGGRSPADALADAAARARKLLGWQ